MSLQGDVCVVSLRQGVFGSRVTSGHSNARVCVCVSHTGVHVCVCVCEGGVCCSLFLPLRYVCLEGTYNTVVKKSEAANTEALTLS